MLTTLDHLEHHISSKKHKNIIFTFGKEVKIFVTIFIVIFVINSVTTNAQLYREAVVDLVQGFSGNISPQQVNDVSTQLDGNKLPYADVDKDFIAKKTQLEAISLQAEAMNFVNKGDFAGQDVVQSNLKESLSSYSLAFNTLPPSDRIIVPDIGLNVPLLQSSFTKNISEITKEDMDKDLFKGVVQYPTTPIAGVEGNMLVFGHTSYESWKSNPYATVFSKLPKLKEGQMMQVIQNGKLYDYKIVTKSIIKPSKVNEEYMKYTKGKYLTLLGCYPIGSDQYRILVVGELVEAVDELVEKE